MKGHDQAIFLELLRVCKIKIIFCTFAKKKTHNNEKDIACSRGRRSHADSDLLRRSLKRRPVCESQQAQLTEALQAHDLATAGAIADSMALYIDDLTPDETVTLLITFLEIHNQAVADGRADDDLVTLRKYVDVYDIAVGANPNDMRNAFADAKRRNPNLDFEGSFTEFRRALAQYDALQDYGEEETPEPATKATPDTVKKEKADSAAVKQIAVD